MQIIVNKLLTNYLEIGSGERSILFLHGWADKGTTFEMLAKELTATNKQYKAVLLDLPGFGATQAPPSAWDLPDYALFVADFLKKANIVPDVIVGHSNGGAIAVNGLASGLLSASKLVLIGSAGIRSSSLKKDILRLLAKPAKLAIKATPKSTQKRIRHKLYSAIGSDYLVAEHMQDTFRKVVNYDVRAEAALINIPTCLIYGQNDNATPLAYGKILAGAISRSEMRVIPEAGHFVHQEQVYKVSNFISEFINRKAVK